ncbi:Bro-N domain-containing protein [Bilophila wadsworthia]|uniref:Bro-N domain-containing protein n=1 Tax=Bilophila wadsworthia TaxID=35833 RepID=UPI0034CF27BD
MDDDEKGTNSIRTPGGEQQMLVISEPGLYSLILRSRKPEAKAFKRWISRGCPLHSQARPVCHGSGDGSHPRRSRFRDFPAPAVQV